MTERTRLAMSTSGLWIAMLWVSLCLGILIALTHICLAQIPTPDPKPPAAKYRSLPDSTDAKLSRIEQWTELHAEDQANLKQIAKDNRALIDLQGNRLTRLETQYTAMTEIVDSFTWWFRAVAVMIGTQLLIAAYEFAKSIAGRQKEVVKRR